MASSSQLVAANETSRRRRDRRPAKTNDKPGRFLNERLMNDLKPTLFLAQLSNLLAGNIAIVHGVIGSSRTFMGEEQAGVDAVRIAHARIAAGQRDVRSSAARSIAAADLHLLFEFKGYNRKAGSRIRASWVDRWL